MRTMNQRPRSFHASSQRFARSASAKKRDHYEVLGVDRGVSKADLKKSYYALAQKYHPDKHQGDKEMEDKFAEIGQAYETLADDQKRAAYDQFGHDAEEMGAGGFGGGGGGFTDAEDLFAQMFGGGQGGFGGGGGGFDFSEMFGQQGQQQSSRPTVGNDLEMQMTIPFMDAVNGTTRTVNVSSKVHCDPCAGSGEKAGSKVKVCQTCGGSGKVTQNQGFFHIESYCGSCGGKGKSVPACGTCGGRGLQRQSRDVDIKIPPGVSSGTKLRLKNQGDAGLRGGPKGNLWVHIAVEKDANFVRDGANIHTEVFIPVWTAMLGGSATVPTLNGQANIKVPGGTQPGHKVVMRNKGIKHLNSSSKGHQYVHFKVSIPENLTDEQRAAAQAFAGLMEPPEEKEEEADKNAESS